MYFKLLVLGALIALPAAAIADSSSGPSQLSEGQRAALERLLDETRNHGMEVRLSRGIGIPAFLRRGDEPLTEAHDDHEQDNGDEPAQDRVHEEETRALMAYLDEHSELFLLEDPEQELLLENVHTDELGGNHYRYQQQVDGVPVHGAELLAHFDTDGAMYALTVQTVPVPDIDTVPGISTEAAGWRAREAFASADVTQETQLQIREIHGEWRLVYAVQSRVDTVNRWTTIVDATDGDVLRHFLDHREGTVSASGTGLDGTPHTFTAWKQDGLHYLVDVTVPAYRYREDPLPGDNSRGDTHVVDLLNTEGDSRQNISSASAHSGWDPAGISAMENSQAAYRYFRNRHGRASIDGKNGSLLSAVHYGNDYDNAFWNGRWMVYGDGGRRFSNLAQCLDMVAHEMTHGVIDHTANLEYENQSGALDESLADVFGVLVSGDDWTLAEDCVKVAPGYLRSMPDPNSGLSWQPAHMSEYVYKPNTEDGDWGGVHANSGIPNRAAYLLMEGLSTEGLGKSIGREKAGRLYYHAMTSYLLSRSDFLDLRRAMLLAAEYLYPDSPAERKAVAAAFDAAGIVEGGDSGPRGTAADGLVASASFVDFGDIAAGETKTRALTLTNETTRSVAVHQLVIEGAAFSHDFSNTQVAPGGSLEGALTFTGPASPGTYSGTLEVFADSNASPLIIDLAATVTKSADAQPPRSASGGGTAHPLALAMLLLAGWFRWRRFGR